MLLLLFTQPYSTVCGPWTASHQAPLSFAVSWSLLKLIFIESMMCQALDNSQMNSKIPLHGSNFDSLFLLLQFSLSLLYFLSPESWPREPDIFPLRFLQFPWSPNFVREKNKFSFLFYFRSSFRFITKSITTSPQAKQLSLTRFQPFKSTWGTISVPHLRGHSLIFLSFMPPSLPPLLPSFLFYSFLFSCLPSTHPASHLPSNAPSIHLSINPIFLSIHSVIHGLSGSCVPETELGAGPAELGKHRPSTKSANNLVKKMEIFANVYEGYEESSMRFQGRRWLILGSVEDDIKKLTFELNYACDEEGGKGHPVEIATAMTYRLKVTGWEWKK